MADGLSVGRFEGGPMGLQLKMDATKTAGLWALGTSISAP